MTPLELRRDRNSKRSLGKAVAFVPVTLRDREAEMAALYLGDGSLVSIEGHLHSALQPSDAYAVRRSRWGRLAVHASAGRAVRLRRGRWGAARRGTRPGTESKP